MNAVPTNPIEISMRGSTWLAVSRPAIGIISMSTKPAGESASPARSAV